MILPIYNCFHPILREKAKAVTEFDEKLNGFVNNMLETMYNADGIGLAANQVGDSRSIFLADEFSGETPKRKPFIFINPKITASSEEFSDYKEGCLSIPKFYETVTRPTEIQIEYQDIDGNPKKIAAGDLLARVIQHESDHLNGILFFDKLTQLKRTLTKSKLRKVETGKFQIHYDMISPEGKYVKALED